MSETPNQSFRDGPFEPAGKDSAANPDGGVFWAVPGLERPRAAGGPTQGVVPVGSYRPSDSPPVADIRARIGILEDIAEVVAVAHAAAQELGARLGRGEGGLGSDRVVLDQIIGLIETNNAVHAATAELVGAADLSGVAGQAAGTGLSTLLTLKAHLTRNQASRLVLGARQANRFELVRQAGLAGAVNQFQAEAITGVLKDLPRDLGPEQLARAEQSLVERAGSLASDALARAGEAVLEEVCPDVAQDVAEAKAARQLRRAESKQFFNVRDNGDGTASLKGLLPSAEAEQLRAVVEKVADKARRLQAQAPDGKLVSRPQARASALVEICRHAQACGQAAPLGAAGARLVVTFKAEDLARHGAAEQGAADQGAADQGPADQGPADQSAADGAGPGARLAVSGERLGWRAFACLACDCEVMRVVLGAKGQILDVGRATRVIPAGIRAALFVRDKGCSFPGCDRPPEVCEAHHVRPWWRGGPTNIRNLVLLCPSHHRLVEPPRNGPPGWEPELRDDGLWEFKPPTWFDPDRKALLHHRFQT